MVETDVPTDLLDLKLDLLSFYSSSTENRGSHGPNMALLAILANPEVKAFRKAHNIGPASDDSVMPGDAMSGKPIVYGKLKEVTVSQALDYVLQRHGRKSLRADVRHNVRWRIVREKRGTSRLSHSHLSV
jgi:hypothetical protein